MIVKTAENGWPGIFIPGDEALSLSRLLQKTADALVDKTVEPEKIAIFMRSTAKQLAACEVEEKPRHG